MKYLILILFLAGCASYKDAPLKDEPVVAPPEPIDRPRATSPVFKVEIEAVNYNESQLKKLEEAKSIIEKIMNSKEYREAVEGYSFNGQKKFDQSLDLSNDAIYTKLIGGAEELKPDVDNTMNLKVQMYYKLGKVVGYTYPGSLVVYTNSRFHNNFTPCRVASNLVHEWTHKMGFGHRSAKDKDSVPYAHNKIVESLCDKATSNSLSPSK